MLRQRYRYPYTGAGRYVAPLYGLSGLLGGLIQSRSIAHAPPPPVNAVLWGIVGALVSYLVFASEGPGRPAPVWQGVAADGVVSGILISTIGTTLDVLAAGGAGTSGGGLTLGSLLTVLAAALAGALCGAAVGLTALLMGGRARLERLPLSPPSRGRSARRSRPRRKR